MQTVSGRLKKKKKKNKTVQQQKQVTRHKFIAALSSLSCRQTHTHTKREITE